MGFWLASCSIQPSNSTLSLPQKSTTLNSPSSAASANKTSFRPTFRRGNLESRGGGRFGRFGRFGAGAPAVRRHLEGGGEDEGRVPRSLGAPWLDGYGPSSSRSSKFDRLEYVGTHFLRSILVGGVPYQQKWVKARAPIAGGPSFLEATRFGGEGNERTPFSLGHSQFLTPIWNPLNGCFSK